MVTAPSLFGATPESIQQARDAALNAQATSYANMDPFQRANFGIYKGANQLGGAVGGMLGAQDPAMQQAQRRKALVQGLDLSNPQALLQAAQQASDNGDMGAAQELYARATEIAKTQLDARKTEAGILKDNAATAASTFGIGETARIEGLAQSGKFTSESITKFVNGTGQLELIDKFAKPTAAFAAKAVELGFGDKSAYGGYTPEQAGKVNAALIREDISGKIAGRSTTTIDIGGNSFDKGLGEGQSKQILANKILAEDAVSIMATNTVARELLTAGAITGSGAEFLVGLNNALKQGGIDFGYADAAANSQAYTAALGANVGRIIKQFGAGTGLSDADRAYAEQMAAGKITLTETAIRRILDINDRMARNVIKRHNKSVEGIKSVIPLTVEMPSEVAVPLRGNNIPAPDARAVPQATNRGALGTAGNPIKLD